VRRAGAAASGSGLNVVLAAIILWNTIYLERVILALREAGQSIDEMLLPPARAAGMGTHQPHWRRNSSDEARIERLPGEEGFERGKQLDALFVERGQIAAQAAERLGASC
jgi:hypothetical protein